MYRTRWKDSKLVTKQHRLSLRWASGSHLPGIADPLWRFCRSRAGQPSTCWKAQSRCRRFCSRLYSCLMLCRICSATEGQPLTLFLYLHTDRCGTSNSLDITRIRIFGDHDILSTPHLFLAQQHHKPIIVSCYTNRANHYSCSAKLRLKNLACITHSDT